MKYFIQRGRRFLAFVFGFVYLFSGFTKLLDPVGATLVMESYFDFLHIGFLDFAAKPAAILFALAEACLGAALINGVWRKVAAISAFVLQGIFTLLTVALVIFNPNMDCGCFGEVAHLSHSASLWKNIILCLILVGAFIPFREFGKPARRKYVSFAIVSVSLVAFTIWSALHIPLIDYTSFAPGVSLRAADNSGFNDEDVYESVFVYEKNGRQKTFTLDNIPDSTWTFVETNTVRKDDATDSSVVLSIYDSAGEYKDEIAARGRVLIVSIYEPQKAKWDRIDSFVSDAFRAGFKPLVLVFGTSEQVAGELSVLSPEQQLSLRERIYYSDFKTLITMNRSNGGVTYFSDGYLITKWCSRHIPDMDSLVEVYADDETEVLAARSSRSRLIFQGFRLFVLAVLLLV